jgi:hypothetical protein
MQIRTDWSMKDATLSVFGEPLLICSLFQKPSSDPLGRHPLRQFSQATGF